MFIRMLVLRDFICFSLMCVVIQTRAANYNIYNALMQLHVELTNDMCSCTISFSLCPNSKTTALKDCTFKDCTPVETLPTSEIINRCSEGKPMEIFNCSKSLSLHMASTWILRLKVRCRAGTQNPSSPGRFEMSYEAYPELPTFNYSDHIQKSQMRPLRKLSGKIPGNASILGAVRCPFAHYGQYCTNVDHCLLAPCPKGSSCRNQETSRECLCQPGACSGHGNCSIINDTIKCQCDEGYHANGSTCIDDHTQGYTEVPSVQTGQPSRIASLSVIVGVSVSSVSASCILVIIIVILCIRRKTANKKLSTEVPVVFDESEYQVANNIPSEYDSIESLYDDPEAYAYTAVHEELRKTYYNEQNSCELTTLRHSYEAEPSLPPRNDNNSHDMEKELLSPRFSCADRTSVV